MFYIRYFISKHLCFSSLQLVRENRHVFMHHIVSFIEFPRHDLCSLFRSSIYQRADDFSLVEEVSKFAVEQSLHASTFTSLDRY